MPQNSIIDPAATQSTFSSNMPFGESVIVTYLSYVYDRKNSLFQEAAYSKENTVLSFMQSGDTREVNLDNQPQSVLDTAELPSENLTITNLMGA
jgi:hypothetical protein